MTITERPTTESADRFGYDLTPWERKFIGIHIFIAIIALGIGSLIGPLQALEFSQRISEREGDTPTGAS